VNGFYSMRTGSTCTLRWTRKVYWNGSIQIVHL
jgi:hypothetical protein